MLKVEKKLISFVEKNMLVLAGILVTLLALELRRRAIWVHTDDFVSYFDQHENCVQTAFYYEIVKLLGHITEIPYHGIKWMAAIADMVVAVCCWKIVGKCGEELQQFILYTVCLFGPVFFLRGSVWAREDSIATALVLIAYLGRKTYGYKENGDICPWSILFEIPAALGIAFYPFSFLWVLLLHIYGEGKKGEKRFIECVLPVAIAVCVNLISGKLQGCAPGQSFYTMFRFLSYDPVSGEKYSGAVEWLYQMLLAGGYSISLLYVLGTYRKKVSVYSAIAVQLFVMICYGAALGWM